jgi:hypothetical protein
MYVEHFPIANGYSEVREFDHRENFTGVLAR